MKWFSILLLTVSICIAGEKVTKTTIGAEGSIQGGTAPFTLIGANFNHLFSISKYNDFSITAGIQYQKIAGVDLRKFDIAVRDDMLIKEDWAFFSALAVKRNDIKKQRLLGKAMIGGGYDFLGKYNRGDDLIYSIGFGYQHEDAKTENHNDLIFTQRFKYDYATNKIWGITVEFWLKHVVVPTDGGGFLSPKEAFKTLESWIDLKLRQKQFLGKKNLNFHIGINTSYDNLPLPGTTYFNYLIKFGFDFILSER